MRGASNIIWFTRGVPFGHATRDVAIIQERISSEKGTVTFSRLPHLVAQVQLPVTLQRLHPLRKRVRHVFAAHLVHHLPQLRQLPAPPPVRPIDPASSSTPMYSKVSLNHHPRRHLDPPSLVVQQPGRVVAIVFVAFTNRSRIRPFPDLSAFRYCVANAFTRTHRSLICNISPRFLSVEPVVSPFREDFFFEAMNPFPDDLLGVNSRPGYTVFWPYHGLPIVQ